ncbi:hypothetical protein AM587_10013924 [Phytophthora nicotianae]|uniref:Uncharacterized protein n=1 Tax=Phytophthora nicotianae TaxID=4792 RepID=A0A0W8DBH5_PHYNI|nr:hypothetical protein AM587_10013924 [Phytophthora nicotianae]
MAADGTRRIKHWAFRLANVVLSDNLFMRLIETTGINFDRADLDEVQSLVENQFWSDVATATQMMRPFKALLTTILLLKILILVSLCYTARLNCKDLWKELASFYSICAANFRLSGTHERQFKPFVQGKMALLYLWYWLKISLVTEPSVPTLYVQPF